MTKIKAASSKPDPDPVKTLEDVLEDFDYQEQQMIINGHMSVEDFEETDYYRLIEIMKARPREKRPKSLFDLADRLDGRG